jgi:hypothetical protein
LLKVRDICITIDYSIPQKQTENQGWAPFKLWVYSGLLGTQIFQNACWTLKMYKMENNSQTLFTSKKLIEINFENSCLNYWKGQVQLCFFRISQDNTLHVAIF